MGWWLIFAVFLYLVCAAMIIAEVFIPSGGLLTIFALGCLASGIAIFFNHSRIAGWTGVGIAFVMIPTALIISYRIFPKTRFGKAVMLTPPERQQGDAVPDTDRIRELLGTVGVTLTALRPVGACDFSGRRVECVAESGYVDKGKKVKVINVQSTQVTVRMVEES